MTDTQFDKVYYESNNYEDYRFREPRYHKMAAEMATLFDQLKLVNKESRILDYGCSFGFLIRGFQELSYSNVCGYDISKYASDVARSQNVEILNSPQGTYDLVLAMDVFEHMHDSQLEQFQRDVQCKFLVGRIPVSSGGADFHLAVSRKDPTHINCKTKEQWKLLLRSWGFNTVLHVNLTSFYDSDGVFCFLASK